MCRPVGKRRNIGYRKALGLDVRSRDHPRPNSYGQAEASYSVSLRVRLMPALPDRPTPVICDKAQARVKPRSRTLKDAGLSRRGVQGASC
jgi:hypothetical protein